MTAPAGCISLAQDYWRKTLAGSATLQVWAGVHTDPSPATAVLERIHHEALPPPDSGGEYTLSELQSLRPYVIVWTEEESGFELNISDMDASQGFVESGSLRAELVQDVPSEIADDPAEVDLQFRNTVGQILDDMAALAGQAGYLAFTRIVASGPHRAHPEHVTDMGDFQVYELLAFWGVRS